MKKQMFWGEGMISVCFKRSVLGVMCQETKGHKLKSNHEQPRVSGQEVCFLGKRNQQRLKKIITNQLEWVTHAHSKQWTISLLPNLFPASRSFFPLQNQILQRLSTLQRDPPCIKVWMYMSLSLKNPPE